MNNGCPAFTTLNGAASGENLRETDEKLQENLFLMKPNGTNPQGSSTSLTRKDLDNNIDFIKYPALKGGNDGINLEELIVELGAELERLPGLTDIKEESDCVESMLKEFLASFGIGSRGVGFGNGDGVSSFESNGLMSIFQEAVEGGKDSGVSGEGSGRSFSGEAILRAFLAGVGTGSRGVGFGNGDGLSSFEGNDLRGIFQEAVTGGSELGVSGEGSGRSFSGEAIFRAFLVGVGTGSRGVGFGNGDGVSSFEGNDLRSVFQEALTGGKEPEVLEEESGRLIPKSDILKSLLTETGMKTDRLSMLTDRYEAPVAKEEILKGILIKSGLNPEEVRTIINGEKYGRKGCPEDDITGIKLTTILHDEGSLNDKMVVTKGSDSHLTFPEDKEASKATMGEKVLNQIVEKIRAQFSNGRNQMTIELKPEFLGRLHMKVSVQNQHVMAKIIVESPLIKEIIETNAHQLKFSLLEHGLKVDKFSVLVGYNQSQSGRDNGEPSSERKVREYNPEGEDQTICIGEEDVPQLKRAMRGQGLVDFFA